MNCTSERFEVNGCWYCKKTDKPMCFSFEFDTNVHIKCLIDTRKLNGPNDRECQIMFAEICLEEGDELLEPYQRCRGDCFELRDDGNWHEIEELEARVVLPGELIVRRVDKGKKADSFNQ